MLPEEIAVVIKRIINLERDVDGNAAEIERISLEAIEKLRSVKDVDPALYKFLDDFDLRRRDASYLNYQTDKVISILDVNKIPPD